MLTTGFLRFLERQFGIHNLLSWMDKVCYCASPDTKSSGLSLGMFAQLRFAKEVPPPPPEKPQDENESPDTRRHREFLRLKSEIERLLDDAQSARAPSTWLHAGDQARLDTRRPSSFTTRVGRC